MNRWSSERRAELAQAIPSRDRGRPLVNEERCWAGVNKNSLLERAFLPTIDEGLGIL